MARVDGSSVTTTRRVSTLRLVQPGKELTAEPVAGQPAQKGDVAAQSTDGPSRVVRPTTERRPQPAGWVDDEVHEALAGDDDGPHQDAMREQVIAQSSHGPRGLSIPAFVIGERSCSECLRFDGPLRVPLR